MIRITIATLACILTLGCGGDEAAPAAADEAPAAAEAEVRGRHRERRPQERGEGMGRWWEPRLGGRASSRAARVCG